MFGDSGLSTPLHVDARLDLGREHVLDDERLVFLLLHEIRDAVANGRPRHPGHHVAEARVREVLEPAIDIEAGGQVAHDRAVFGRHENDVELLVATVAGRHGDEVAGRRRLDGNRARILRALRIGRQVLSVVCRPLFVAKRLEPILQILFELLIELAGRDLERFFVGARSPADGALAQREEELAHPVFVPPCFDEPVQRVAEVVHQARAAEVAVTLHLAHARDDVGHSRVAHRHQIERIPDAALVFGSAFVHPQRHIAADERGRDDVVLEARVSSCTINP